MSSATTCRPSRVSRKNESIFRNGLTAWPPGEGGRPAPLPMLAPQRAQISHAGRLWVPDPSGYDGVSPRARNVN